MKKIIIGSDHGGYALKEEIKKYLSSNKISIEDVGTKNEDSCDYPDFAAKVAKRVLATHNTGILICGTGIGVCISANKFAGIRAALCYNQYTAQMAREHNDANILCMGGRTTSISDAKVIVDTFLNTKPSSEQRHKNRIHKISDLEKTNCTR